MPRIVQPSSKIITATPNILDVIENAARKCYLSEPKCSTNETDRIQERADFLRSKIKLGHHSILEHGCITVEFVCDRGVSHEEVRHRLQAISQESTRYCNYSKDKFGNEIAVITPFFFDSESSCDTLVELPQSMFSGNGLPRFNLLYDSGKGYAETEVELNKFDVWFLSMQMSEWAYLTLLKMGATPQEARSVLPNSLKTELVCTANVREWKLILNTRAVGATGTPHPQMLEIMIPLLKQMYEEWPILFEQEYLAAQEKGRFEWWDANCK